MSLNGLGDPPSLGSYPPFLRRSPIGVWNRTKDVKPSTNNDINDKITVKVTEHYPKDSKFSIRFQTKTGGPSIRESTILISPHKIDIEKSRSLIRGFQESRGSASNVRLMLNSSFSLSRPSGNEVKETKDVACETVSGMLRRKFDSIADYNNWCKEKVDPFMAKLKREITNTKPESIESFVIGFAAREAMGQPHNKLPEISSVSGGGEKRSSLIGGTVKKVGFDGSDKEIDSAFPSRNSTPGHRRRSSVA